MDESATILVVDDRPQNVRLLEAILVPRGFTVLAATSGAAALDAVAEGRPDLILLDLHMPEMDGYEVCRRLRNDPQTRYLPVVVVTAADDGSKTAAIEAGADDFIRKPLDQAELLVRVRSLLRIKRYHDTIESQSAQLTEWNRTLEDRVETQVHDLERFDRLRRFLSPPVADLVLSENDRSLLEPHRQDIAVLFCDLRGFTAASHAAEPEELLAALAEFHVSLGELVARYHATVGFFAGDGVMVFFNDPVPCDQPALTAVRMAVDMRDRMTEFLARWRRRGYDLGVGVGIARGYATLGTIGFEGRHDYTAIGVVVNLASRLCSEAGDGEILISQRAVEEIEGHADVKELPDLQLRGFTDPTPAWSVVRVDVGDTQPTERPAQSGSNVQFRVLGSLELLVGGHALEIRPGKERALLTLLLMHANRAMSADELITGLWPDPPPDSALTGLRVYVFRVRRTLAEAGLQEILTTHSGGYVLSVGDGQLDATAFEEGVQRGRARMADGDPVAAAADLRDALALWRGPAFADVADAEFARAEAARLDEARVCALEDRIQADLACGRHGAVIAELDALVAVHAYRERFWAQRMLALYRAGRQAEALAAYQEVRRQLADELGLEPSPELTRLEQQILVYDDALSWVAVGTKT